MSFYVAAARIVRWGLIGFLAVSFVVARPLPLPASEGDCDSDLIQRVQKLGPSGDAGYKYRAGDLCDGFYSAQLSGSRGLSLSSLIVGSLRIKNDQKTITLRWNDDSGPVHITAAPLQSNIYYRMDAVRVSGVGSLEYPLERVRAAPVDPNRLGLIASATSPSSQKRLYLPIRIGTPGASVGTQVHLIVIPGTDVGRILLTVSRLKSDLSFDSPIRNAQALASNSFSAGQPIDIPLPHEVTESGVYFISVSSRDSAGDPVDLAFYLKSA